MNPQDQAATARVVIAGKQLMYAKETFPMLKQGMMKKGPLADKLAAEAVGIVKMLQDKANGSIPRQVLIPAASLLLVEIAKFMEDAGLAQPTPQDIKAAGAKLIAMMQQAFPAVEPRQAVPSEQPGVPPPQPAAGAGLIQSV